MILHGVEKGSIKDQDFETREFLEIEKMEDSPSKHKKMVLLNPDNYKSWNYLKEMLIQLETSGEVELYAKLMQEQLKLTQAAIEVNPKSYSAWHHRFFLMSKINSTNKILYEYKLCKILLSFDSRNFHCWNYCKKLNIRFPIDYSNYSSMFFSETKNESCIFTDPNDEASWRYFQKLEQKFVQIKRFENKIAILFKDPFKGDITINGTAIVANVWSNVLYTDKIILEDEITTDFNGSIHFLSRKKEPKVVDCILSLEPDCIFALKERLKYIKCLSKRESIINRLCSIDPLRTNYYRGLLLKYCDIFE